MWPLTRPADTLSPRGEGKVTFFRFKELSEGLLLTSSSPLGERMPVGQVRGCFLLFEEFYKRLNAIFLINGCTCFANAVHTEDRVAHIHALERK